MALNMFYLHLVELKLVRVIDAKTGRIVLSSLSGIETFGTFHRANALQ
jgi:hypothetical protein